MLDLFCGFACLWFCGLLNCFVLVFVVLWYLRCLVILVVVFELPDGLVFSLVVFFVCWFV